MAARLERRAGLEPGPRAWPIDVAAYRRMGEAGIIGEGFELLEGEIVERGLGKPRRFTVDEHHRMGAAGIIGPDARTELIEGEIIALLPIGWRPRASAHRDQHASGRHLRRAWPCASVRATPVKISLLGGTAPQWFFA